LHLPLLLRSNYEDKRKGHHVKEYQFERHSHNILKKMDDMASCAIIFWRQFFDHFSLFSSLYVLSASRLGCLTRRHHFMSIKVLLKHFN